MDTYEKALKDVNDQSALLVTDLVSLAKIYILCGKRFAARRCYEYAIDLLEESERTAITENEEEEWLRSELLSQLRKLHDEISPLSELKK